MSDTARLDLPLRADAAHAAPLGGVRLPAPVLAGICIGFEVAFGAACFAAAESAAALGAARSPAVLDAALIGASVGAAAVAVQSALGGYRPRALAAPRVQVLNHVCAWIVALLVAFWVAHLAKSAGGLARDVVLLAFVAALAVGAPLRLFAAMALRRALSGSRVALARAAVLHGLDEAGAQWFFASLSDDGVGFAERRMLPPTGRDAAVEAFADACRALSADAKLDKVYVALPWSDIATAEIARRKLAGLHVPVHLIVDTGTAPASATRRASVAPIGVKLHAPPLSWSQRARKRVFDVAFAAAALVMLAPLMALVAAAILFETGRPIVFRQTRRGLGGQPFQIYKFRSMSVCEDGPAVRQAQRGDTRITPLGSVLRRLSLDELPQLVNVLRGEMSIVGPRPHAVAHDAFYSGLIEAYCDRQRVKPGLTGLAQVSGCRGETRDVAQMAERVRYDLEYVERWSLWLDLKIVARTALLILRDANAY